MNIIAKKMLRRVSTKVASVTQMQKRWYFDSKSIDTLSLHAGWEPDATTACCPPVYRTTSYVFESSDKARKLFALEELGNIYSRIMNPTHDVLEKRVSMMEGAHPMAGLGLSSGTAAAFYSVLNLARVGDNIIAANNMYGGTHTMFNDIFPQTFGITVKMVDFNDPATVAAAIDDKTRAVFGESCSNPALDVMDIEAIADVAHAHGLPLIVDSTFSTPYLTQPLAHGADIVMHSLTKWLGGHGTAIGGIVVDGGKFNWAGGKHPIFDEPASDYHGLRWGHDLPDELSPLAYILRMRTTPLRNLGACITPDNSWIILQGIETLSLRMEKHCSNALKVAEYLKDNKNVEWVRFPGLPGDKMYDLSEKYLKGLGGGMVVFEMKGGKEAGQTFVESLKLHRHLANVGDSRSLVCHPATTTHSQLEESQQISGGITPGLIRLSVGLENPDDIIADIEQALAVALG